MIPGPGDDRTDGGYPAGPGPVVAGTALRLRYPAVCGCGTALPTGTAAVWDPADRRVWCLPCARPVPAQPGAEPAPVVVAGAVMAAARPVPAPAADGGRAGASLHRTYEARNAARQSRVRAAHPRLGGLLLAVSGEPASTTAFARGAAGEQRLAADLAAACGTRVLFLHNRRLGPGRRDGDLDHIAVAPGGVFVIDAKNLTAARVAVRTSRRLFSPDREQLIVSGRNRTSYVEGSLRQQAAVTAALAVDDDLTGAGGVDVAGVLCFLDASIDGWRWRPPRVGGVHVLSPAGTARLLRRPGPLDAEDRRVVWDHLHTRLPPA